LSQRLIEVGARGYLSPRLPEPEAFASCFNTLLSLRPIGARGYTHRRPLLGRACLAWRSPDARARLPAQVGLPQQPPPCHPSRAAEATGSLLSRARCPSRGGQRLRASPDSSPLLQCPRLPEPEAILEPEAD